MRYPGVLHIAAVTVVLLVTWGIAMNSIHIQEKIRDIYGFNDVDQMEQKIQTRETPPGPKCSLSRVCPSGHFAFHIRSGAANVVGPRMCFDGKIIMSQALNNVGLGLNIVVVDGENGLVESICYLNKEVGNAEGMLTYLKEIKPGMIVLVASFDDATTKMTNEIREVFAGMGSTLITTVKRRDSWVFAGTTGTGNKSLFEKQAVNDEKTNIYGGWPAMVEVGGCIPRTPTDGQKL